MEKVRNASLSSAERSVLLKPPAEMKDQAISSARQRRRNTKASQESLTDHTGTGSSTDSLQEDGVARPVFSSTASLQNNHDAVDGLLGHSPGEQEVSLSGTEKNPDLCSPAGQRVTAAKVCLSPLQSCQSPSADLCTASTSLRTANEIDEDCEDYAAVARGGLGRLHRNHCDCQLSETMVSDNTSLNSMKSSFSVLNPIRPKDARNR